MVCNLPELPLSNSTATGRHQSMLLPPDTNPISVLISHEKRADRELTGLDRVGNTKLKMAGFSCQVPEFSGLIQLSATANHPAAEAFK